MNPTWTAVCLVLLTAPNLAVHKKDVPFIRVPGVTCDSVSGFRFATSADECNEAAAALVLTDTIVDNKAMPEHGIAHQPHGCYYKEANIVQAQLWFNPAGDRQLVSVGRDSICINIEYTAEPQTLDQSMDTIKRKNEDIKGIPKVRSNEEHVASDNGNHGQDKVVGDNSKADSNRHKSIGANLAGSQQAEESSSPPQSQKFRFDLKLIAVKAKKVLAMSPPLVQLVGGLVTAAFTALLIWKSFDISNSRESKESENQFKHMSAADMADALVELQRKYQAKVNSQEGNYSFHEETEILAASQVEPQIYSRLESSSQSVLHRRRDPQLFNSVNTLERSNPNSNGNLLKTSYHNSTKLKTPARLSVIGKSVSTISLDSPYKKLSRV